MLWHLGQRHHNLAGRRNSGGPSFFCVNLGLRERMKLICHPISPYARKAMILARVSGIELNEVQPAKNGAHGYAAGDNPLGKIPALEWQPGQYLFDSPVICEYLDSLRDTPLLPAKGHPRYLQLWQHAIGDGVSDAVYQYRQETVRPPDLHWDAMIERHDTAIRDTVATLANICQWLGTPWTYGNLAIICGLDYASYRAPQVNWRADHPELAKWHANFVNDPAYLDTYAYGTA